jgi:threonyl-tRNA synthetase
MDIKTKRHSYSHILAQAIKHIYGNDVKMWIWPDIDNWFYYDFDFLRGWQKIKSEDYQKIEISDKDLKNVQKEMQNIIKQNQKFIRFSLPVDEAISLLEDLQEPYKVELAKELKEKWETEIWFYANIKEISEDFIQKIPEDSNKRKYLELLRQIKQKYNLNKFVWENTLMFLDMCAWPHVEETSQLDPKAVKLVKIAGAYWKGDANNPMLTRIYGYAFNTKEELDNYLKFLEEAKKRDHRLIGKRLDIFSFSENVGLWLPLWHPMGGRIWRSLEDFWLKEHRRAGYEFVRTPHIWNKKLWETSWHWGFYSDSMYPPLEVGQTLEDAKAGKKVKESESEKYLLKPMNCPFHIEIFKSSPKSYREFPLRWAETGTVYRYEKKWELTGLTRVRWFTQDDAHIFCRPDQVKEEITKVIDFIEKILKTFWLEYQAYLSFRDPKSTKYVWSDQMWELAQNTLKEVAEEKGLNAPIEEGEAAFYGPKIDFRLKDCLGREHQCSTVQFDFNLPERFDLTYTNKEWKPERPIMIHRALFWSFERFISILIEHYGWTFPLWLAPRQVIVIPVSDKFDDYAKQIKQELLNNDIFVDVDLSSDSFAKKIRNAEKLHINYILVVWEKELKNNTVSVRNYKTKEQTEEKIGDFIKRIKQEIETKAL